MIIRNQLVAKEAPPRCHNGRPGLARGTDGISQTNLIAGLPHVNIIQFQSPFVLCATAQDVP
jgi:hypothetical protein